MPLNSFRYRRAARRSLTDEQKKIKDIQLINAVIEDDLDRVIHVLNEGADPNALLREYGFGSRYGVPLAVAAGCAVTGGALGAAVLPAMAGTTTVVSTTATAGSTIVGVTSGGLLLETAAVSTAAGAALGGGTAAVAGNAIRMGLFSRGTDSAEKRKAVELYMADKRGWWFANPMGRIKGNCAGDDRAVHVAAALGSIPILEVLIIAGADPKAMTVYGLYIYNLCPDTDKEHVRALFEGGRDAAIHVDQDRGMLLG